jgi:hypothetical protein
MIGKDLQAVIDAASKESTCARIIHRETTKQRNFPEGSRGQEYCDNLRRLVFMLMNGSIHPDATPPFLSTAKPLIEQLLQKWEIGNLRRFLPLISDLTQIREQQLELWRAPKELDPLVVVASRPEVEASDTAPTLSVLRQLTGSPETARRFFEGVDLTFFGYDEVPQELWEILAVRDFVNKLDEQFPFWLFFLSKRHLGLQCLLLCVLPPFLTEEGRSEIFPERIDRLLTRRWFPAMNHICEYVGFSEQEVEQLTDRVIAYIAKGRLPPAG